MIKMKKGLAVAVACVAVVAVGAVSIGAADVGGGKEAVTAETVDNRLLVTTVQPVQGDIIIQGEFIGTVSPSHTVTVYPKAAGEVLTVHFDVGDRVEAGDVLCEIDSKALRTSIEQTKASLASAQAKADYSLAMAKTDLETAEFNAERGYESTVLSAEAGVESAKKAVETAENRLAAARVSANSARYALRDLRDEKSDTWISPTGSSYDAVERQYLDAVRQAELAQDAAELTVEQAKNGLAQAQDTLEMLKVLSKEQRESATARVRMAELTADLSDQYLTIKKLEDDLENYRVTTSISGVVEQRNIDPFNMATQQTPVFVIANKDAMTISFRVSESVLAHIKLGDKITIDKNGKTGTGIISEISSTADAYSGLFVIEATVEDAEATLYSGSTVKVQADTQKALGSLIVPVDSIYYENGRPFVYIADNGIARQAFVETGLSDDEFIQILSGLTTSDAIVSAWSSGLTDGAEIKLGAGEESR